MSVNIHATEKALHKIFCNDYAFEIPPYQRPYAWTKEQASELLSDVLAFLGDDTLPVAQINPYFLGSIVLIQNVNSAQADVVDGQQRLTTLTILLAVLRTKVDTTIGNEITKYLYEKGEVGLGTSNRYRLKLRERDADFFIQYVQNEKGLDNLFQLNEVPLTDSQKNIKLNSEYFVNEIEKLSDSQRLRLYQYLVLRCYLVVVSTPDLDSAYRIFSVLNARGLDLGLTDLLKSEIIGAIPKTLQDKYNNIWEQEEEDLGREIFQELFSHIRMIHQKKKLQKTVLKEFREDIKPQENPREFIDDVLKPYSDALETIKKESYQSSNGAEKMNVLFGWLNQIDNFDWLPPAILYFSQHRNSQIELEKFFTDLERLASGLMIIRADINTRIKRYGELLTAIENKIDLYVTDSPLQLNNDEIGQIIKNLDGDLYLQNRISKYVLLRLDSALAGKGAVYNHSVVSIEHILPQNPANGSQWTQWFPTDVEQEKYVHRMGNLALLDRNKNSEAKNYEFDYKKKVYFVSKNKISPFVLTTQVLKETEWTQNIVEERQKQLLQALKGLWRL
jgi:uncharacterized protein with ParB-like and HNH nuclease domain